MSHLYQRARIGRHHRRRRETSAAATVVAQLQRRGGWVCLSLVYRGTAGVESGAAAATAVGMSSIIQTAQDYSSRRLLVHRVEACSHGDCVLL